MNELKNEVSGRKKDIRKLLIEESDIKQEEEEKSALSML